MLRFTKQISLFNNTTLLHYEPISGKVVITETTEQEMKATKQRIVRETLINLCTWFYQNRSGANDFMVKAAPQKITKSWKVAFSSLRVAINRTPEYSQITSLAKFIHFHIYPNLVTLAPRRDDAKTERYNNLLNELDQNICAILYQGSGDILAQKKGVETPIF